MSAVVECPAQLDRHLSAIGQTLRELFGEEFGFWFQADQDWMQTFPAGAEATVPQTRPDVLELLGEARDPRVFVADGGGWTLAIPLTIRTVRIVALADLATGDADQLVRFAQLALRELEQRRELQRLDQENQAFLRQVTDDFEELTFLRSMAGLLEVSDLTFDLVAMAEKVLPLLRPLCDADSMVLVTARRGEERQEVPQVDGPRLWCGDRSIDDPSCVKLVEHFRKASQTKPVVRNHLDQEPDSETYCGIESLVMVPIVNNDTVIGWMLALNRNNDRNLMVEDPRCEVSYVEFGTHEATLMSSTASILATHARNVELFREREELLVSVVRALVSAIEAKDEYTRGHSERVALYGKRLAEELELGEDYCERLYLTGLLHDVGKIGIRDAVLRKPGPLTDEEFEEIKQHPDKGWEILSDLEPLKYVLPGVLHHHEQMDGKGYPDRLVGEQIPLVGRILAVADAFDAMTSDRPYRSGMPQHKAESILRRGAGTQWDAELIDAFFKTMPDILQIRKTYQPRAVKRRK